MSRSSLQPRRRPRQRRSRETVDAILEGAARVFAERGHAGGTTNHIAEAAGVSVGSLYEYFPNKDAILVALAERQRDAMVERVRGALRDPGTTPAVRPVLEGLVVGLLDAHATDPQLHRVLFTDAPHPPELHACVLQMEESLTRDLQRRLERCPGVVLGEDDTVAHLVVQTAEALTHRFVETGLHELSTDDFVVEVVALLEGYVAGAGRRQGRPR